MTPLLFRGVLALGVCLSVAPVVLAVLRRANVLDHPSDRSSHVAPVPRGGGVAPALAAVLALALTPSLSSTHKWAIALVAATFGALGLVDDVVGIRALHRL